MKKILFTILAISLFATTARAQSEGVLVLSIFPENPEPGDTITATVQSFLIDLDSADISWSVGGVEQARDIGLRSLRLVAGEGGSSFSIRVTARTVSGQSFSEGLVVRPGSVDIIWEADTYTPPFYKGRALFTFGSRVRAVAMPEVFDSGGSKIPDSRLVFRWSRDGRFIQSASGVGRSTFGFVGSPSDTRSPTVSVEVSPIDGPAAARKSVTVPMSTPLVLLYQNRPLLGMDFRRALTQSMPDSGDEVLVRAYPYFYSNDDLDSLIYSWRVNNESVARGGSRNLDLSRAGEISNFLISLNARNPLKIFQTDDTSVRLNFKEENEEGRVF